MASISYAGALPSGPCTSLRCTNPGSDFKYSASEANGLLEAKQKYYGLLQNQFDGLLENNALEHGTIARKASESTIYNIEI